MPSGLTQTAYAKRVKISRGRVGQLIDDGLPVTADGKINPAIADRWIAEHVDRERRAAERRGRQAPVSAAVADVRRQKLSADARLAELELRRREGSLVAKSEVERFVFARAQMERDRWLGFIARTAPVLASELDVDLSKAFSFLDRVIRAQLLELSDTEVAP